MRSCWRQHRPRVRKAPMREPGLRRRLPTRPAPAVSSCPARFAGTSSLTPAGVLRCPQGLAGVQTERAEKRSPGREAAAPCTRAGGGLLKGAACGGRWCEAVSMRGRLPGLLGLSSTADVPQPHVAGSHPDLQFRAPSSIQRPWTRPRPTRTAAALSSQVRRLAPWSLQALHRRGGWRGASHARRGHAEGSQSR